MGKFESVIPIISHLDVIRLANALPAILEITGQHKIQKTTAVHQLDDTKRQKHIQDWKEISSNMYEPQDYLNDNIGDSQHNREDFIGKVQWLCNRGEDWRLTGVHAGKLYLYSA